MVFTYLVADDIGKVRLLCNDNVSASAIFQDDEITYFLTMEDSNIRRAAALALETIASNEVLVQKVIRLLDISTNGASESAELLKRAALLRQQADEAESNVDGGIEIAEVIYDPFSYREKILHDAIEDEE